MAKQKTLVVAAWVVETEKGASQLDEGTTMLLEDIEANGIGIELVGWHMDNIRNPILLGRLIDSIEKAIIKYTKRGEHTI